MYGTWCEAHFIPEKLIVKMGNNGRQHTSGVLFETGCDRSGIKAMLTVGHKPK